MASWVVAGIDKDIIDGRQVPKCIHEINDEPFVTRRSIGSRVHG